MSIKVHPLFFALALILILFGQALGLLWTFAALLLHEAGHIAAARIRGYTVRETVLLPYGAMMSVNENFDRTSAVVIGLGGPAVNGVLALIILGIWWLRPALYPVTDTFFYANVSLALFNLLPVYPLDGSRVALGLSRHRIRTLKRLQAAGVALSIALFALFIASAFYSVNFSLGIIAVFLFCGAAGGTQKELYVSVLGASSKNYGHGVVQKRVKISADVPIIRFYHHIDTQSETVFEVMTEEGGIIEIGEERLKELAVNNKLSASVGHALGILRDEEDGGCEISIVRPFKGRVRGKRSAAVSLSKALKRRKTLTF